MGTPANGKLGKTIMRGGVGKSGSKILKNGGKITTKKSPKNNNK